MSQELLRENLKGCYITIPTMFSDKNLDVDTEAIQNHVRFLLNQGVKLIEVDDLTTGKAIWKFFFRAFLRKDKISTS